MGTLTHKIFQWVLFMHFVDSYSRFTWIYFLKHKSDAFDIFLKFKAMVELQFNTKIKVVQSDGGGEFIPISKYLKTQGVVHKMGCPHTHEQNGLAERKIRHVVETWLTLLANAHLPLHFWDEAFYTATCLINKLPTPIRSYKTPYELLFHKTPYYLSFKVFRCSCFPLLKPYNKHKMDFKSMECTFVGYSLSHKGYKCLTPSGKIIISRHVTFIESVFFLLLQNHIALYHILLMPILLLLFPWLNLPLLLLHHLNLLLMPNILIWGLIYLFLFLTMLTFHIQIL